MAHASKPQDFHEAPALGVGDEGSPVRQVQVALTALGVGPGRLDGVYDDRTAESVRRFQGATGLPDTGVVDIATAAALFTPVKAGVGRRVLDLRRTVPTARHLQPDWEAPTFGGARNG